MEKTTQVMADQRNGNLHINLAGTFTLCTAAKLTMVMAQSYQGGGNIFIHTKSISGVEPEARYAFGNLLAMSGLPVENIYFTGEKGLDISHDATRVIIRKKKKYGHGGYGKCKNCTCQTKKAA